LKSNENFLENACLKKNEKDKKISSQIVLTKKNNESVNIDKNESGLKSIIIEDESLLKNIDLEKEDLQIKKCPIPMMKSFTINGRLYPIEVETQFNNVNSAKNLFGTLDFRNENIYEKFLKPDDSYIKISLPNDLVNKNRYEFINHKNKEPFPKKFNFQNFSCDNYTKKKEIV
jgi:hypothetical protein